MEPKGKKAGTNGKVFDKKKAIMLMLLCTLFTATGQILLKIGADKLSKNYLTYLFVLPGLIFYVAGSVLLLYSLKTANLSAVYPFFSLSFVWVLLLSYFFLKEQLSIMQITGILVIICGVSLVGKGS